MDSDQTRLQLVERYVALKDEQKAADKDEVIKRYKEERKARNAECKEILFALMQLVATDAVSDQVVVGDRIVERSTKAKVTVNAATVTVISVIFATTISVPYFTTIFSSSYSFHVDF